jgi:hypothetical protein
MLEASDPRLREMAAFALGRLAQVLIVVALVFALTKNLVFLSQVNKFFTLVMLVLVSLVLLIPIMVMLFLLTLISFLGPA